MWIFYVFLQYLPSDSWSQPSIARLARFQSSAQRDDAESWISTSVVLPRDNAGKWNRFLWLPFQHPLSIYVPSIQPHPLIPITSIFRTWIFWFIFFLPGLFAANVYVAATTSVTAWSPAHPVSNLVKNLMCRLFKQPCQDLGFILIFLLGMELCWYWWLICPPLNWVESSS